jgi:hypothetical protein
MGEARRWSSRVVHQDVYGAVLGDQRIHRGAEHVGHGHVHFQGGVGLPGGAVQFTEHGAQLVAIARQQRDARTEAGQFQRRCFSDALARAANEGVPAVQGSIHAMRWGLLPK